jgi:hypothetical protein
VRRVAANLLILGVATALALLLAEVAVRLVAPQQLIEVRPDIWEAADSLGYVNRPNVHTTINTGERTVHLYTDAEGMRVGASGRHDEPTRVLIIGDSFMEALQVEYRQTFAGLLEASLTRRLGRGVAVYDAGVDGWDPPQYLIQARRLLSRRRYAALVVAIYLGNDVVTRRVDYVPPRAPVVVHHLRIPRSLHWSEVVSALGYPVNDVLKRHSQLFMLLKNRFQTLRQRAGLAADFFPSELRRSQASSPRWSLTAGICAEIAQAARAGGVPSLFVLIPSPFEVDSVALAAFMSGFHVDPATVDVEQPTRLMDGALRARGLATLTMLSDFRSLVQHGTALYGTVDRHLTAAGNRELERLVEPAVASLLGPTPATGAP